jgi:ferredoxin--NADP+ reductase
VDIDALRRKHYNATITGERIHTGTVMIIQVTPDAPVPEPRPGQWMEMGLGIWEPVRDGAEGGNVKRAAPDSLVLRAYSLSSPILTPNLVRFLEPGEWDGLEFFLSLVVPPEERAQRVPNLTGRLFCLRPGDRLFLADTPMGEYTLDPVRPEENVLFLATGTGEAPHNMMIWDLLRRGHPGRVASIVSARRRADLAYESVHRRLAELVPGYRYTGFSTRDPESDGKHIQDYLTEGRIETMAGFPLDPATTRIYLCGNPGLIGPPRRLQGKRVFPESTGMVELLEERGFNADPDRGPVNVHHERYW